MNDPDDASNPLQGLLGDLLKVIGSAPGGATPWLDAARTLAQGVATDNQPEANGDPLERIKLEELSRVAELHVANATGLHVGSGEHPPTFVPVGRGAWAMAALEAYKPILARMVDAQKDATGAAGSAMPGGFDLDAMGAGGLEGLLGQFAVTMGPVLMGMQFGSAAGHLAQRAIGQYSLPLPWNRSDQLLIVPANIATFASDWSLPLEEMQLWVCIRELTMHAVLSRPGVAEAIDSMLADATAQTATAMRGLTDQLGGSMDDPEAIQQLMSDPESLFADMLTPEQQSVSKSLTALTTTICAYVDHITVGIAQSLTGSPGALREAWYRYRTEDAKGEQAFIGLFGLDLGKTQVDRGANFIKGVVDRAGEDSLARLWSDDRNLPTPAEVDAPGLWLERIDLPGSGEDMSDLDRWASSDHEDEGPVDPSEPLD